jgi:hypothetical protein
MVTRSTRDEARRWAKFPATVLFATGFLWLLHSIFNLDMGSRSQQLESVVGILAALLDLIFIPLGGVAIGLGMLFLQRWALWLGFIFPVFPLVILTGEKWQRMGQKFSEWRGGDLSAMEGGVMTGLLVLALWGVFALMVYYLRKALRLLDKAEGWMRASAASSSDNAAAMGPAWGQARAGVAMSSPDDSDVCMLIPDVEPMDEDSEQS